MKAVFLLMMISLVACNANSDSASPNLVVGPSISTCEGGGNGLQVLLTDANHQSHPNAVVTALFDSRMQTLCDMGGDDSAGTLFGAVSWDGSNTETFIVTATDAGYEPLFQSVQLTITYPAGEGTCPVAQLQNNTLTLLPLNSPSN